MTDADYTAWLDDDDAQRVVLVELGVNSGGSELTRYVSSREFISAAGDTPASTLYEPRLAGGLAVQENLGLFSGAASASYGDIELYNTDREIDSWLSDVWRNRTVTAYFGDVSWPKSDFRTIYAGTIESAESSSQDLITIRLQDKMKRLESAVTETKLGGVGPTADYLIPLCFGECHNVTPLLVDSGMLEYSVHNGAIEDIIEVRDNGIPVSITKFPATGRFRLLVSPVGTITASVQGDKPSTYKNDVGNLIERLVTAYGRSDLRLLSADLDTANFTAFKAANTQPVGLYLSDTMTVRQAVDMLADSIGAKVVMTRTGLLQLVKIVLPPASTSVTVTDNDIVGDSLQIADRPQVAAACKLAYCRNWTVQQDVQAGVLPQHKELFAEEWLTATSSDGTAATLHKLSVDVEQEESLLLVTADATTEAARRLTLRSTQRTVFDFEARSMLMQLALGAGISLSSSKFGLSAGASVQVVALEIDWVGGRVKVGVLK